MYSSGYGNITNASTETDQIYFQEMDIQPTAKEEPELGWVFETAFSEDRIQRTSDEKLAEKAAKAASHSPSGFVMARSVIFNHIIEEEIATNPITVKKGDTKKIVLAKIQEAWQNAA
jgi:hypothetical protein